MVPTGLVSCSASSSFSAPSFFNTASSDVRSAAVDHLVMSIWTMPDPAARSLLTMAIGGEALFFAQRLGRGDDDRDHERRPRSAWTTVEFQSWVDLHDGVPKKDAAAIRSAP